MTNLSIPTILLLFGYEEIDTNVFRKGDTDITIIKHNDNL